ncbi:MAG TPA: hypothetical protein VHI52_06180, partial [Verrucomicrobiae bacterium]|nr:hypothetical protein [Verrucomicrobiae bacterium]
MTSPWNGGTQGPESEEGKCRPDSSPLIPAAGQGQDSPRPVAWQPLTPRGVAAFAEASFGRLFGIQLLLAVLITGAVIWFFYTSWFPVLATAIRALPDAGQISAGRLEWKGDPTASLAESPFLAVTVDLDHRGGARSPSHVQIEFGRFNCRIISLFGFLEVEYPRDRTIPFNRTALVPWWGA